jgi:holliday junction DNA helicase RuvA
MFNSISGKITHKGEQSVRIQTGGIEWELETTSGTASSLGQIGSEDKILVYMHHREDVLKLYGFAREEERVLFLELLKVSGIGPRQALRILTGSSPESFLSMLEAGDADSLSRFPGIGKKTAQKILLALRGKLTLTKDFTPEGPLAEIIDSLHEMGYGKREAEEAVSAVRKELIQEGMVFDDKKSEEKEIFRRALLALS